MEHAIPLAVLDDRLRALDAEIQRLTIERGLLQSLRQRAVPVGNQTAPVLLGPSRAAHPAAGHTPSSPPRIKLTDTVAEYVGAHPGLDSAAVADGVLANFGSGASGIGGSDARKTLMTTLGNLVRRGRVVRDERGKHYPAS